jgi:hypothetical protein
MDQCLVDLVDLIMDSWLPREAVGREGGREEGWSAIASWVVGGEVNIMVVG